MSYKDIACDANNLYKSYLAAIRQSKWKDTTKKFMLDFLTNIFSIQDDLENQTLTNSPTHEFVLTERGKIRPITSYALRDRIVRHVLCDYILEPEIRKRVIYDNGASLKGRGPDFQKKRLEVHLRRYYKQYGNEGWILIGDFSKFYDNIIHSIAKQQLLDLVDNDEFVAWLIELIFESFRIDVSYMSVDEFATCMEDLFNKLIHRERANACQEKSEKWMEKSVDIGDQLSQDIGIYYPHPIDNYVKYVRGEKFYARYMDDWYIMNPSKEVLMDLLENITKIAESLGIHINQKKTRIVKISSTFTFLQTKYTLTKDGKVIKRINPKRVTAMRQKLKKLEVKVESGEATYESVENTFRSWMGGHYKLMSKLQRQHLIELYEELFNKEVTIESKKMIIRDRVEGDEVWTEQMRPLPEPNMRSLSAA